MLAQPVFQVSECIEALNQHLSLVGEIVVEGELGRLDVKNGRVLFGTLKDAVSSLDFFSMSHLVKNFRQFEPGMLVQAYGSPGLYKTSGKFRLLVNQLVPVGEGALQIAYDKLTAQLQREGLFAPERKRPLPPWPQTIGLITAVGSSAPADLLKIITARRGGLTIYTVPVNVQGREAIPSILKAFAYLNYHPSAIDLVIIARGGGSLEDLAAFNSEAVCRAVFGCPVPVMAAIGHEDNWSLCDYVADLRASTPSHAAELAVRDRLEVLREIITSHQWLHQRLIRDLKTKETTVNQATLAIRRRLHRLTATVNQTLGKIPVMAVSLQSLLHQYRQTLDHSLPQFYSRLKRDQALKQQDLIHLERLLTSLDYRVVLRRGYSITRLKTGRILKRADQVKPGAALQTQLSHGAINSIVN